jgi:uroporphyrinogen-III decarboxylase
MIDVREYIKIERYSRRFSESSSRIEMARRFEEPDRVPVVLSTNYRFSERFHPISMREYFLDPKKQIIANLLHTRFMLDNFDHDVTGFNTMAPSFHNTVEASGVGCEVFFPEHDVAMARTPLLDDIRDVGKLEVPDPRRDGLMAKCFEYYEVFREELGNQLEVRVGGSCDGIFTLATQLVNPRQIIRAMHDDPSLVRELLELCLETEIVWMRERQDEEGTLNEEHESWHFADDSCQLLSPVMYEKFVAPYQRRFVNTFSKGGVSGIHMCGHVAHLIPTIRRLFHPRNWDFGYPIDPFWAKEVVGDDCVLMGNISPILLASGSRTEVEEAARRCLKAVAPGAGYIMMDGNNIPGDAPLENVRAIVDVAHGHGIYPRN